MLPVLGTRESSVTSDQMVMAGQPTEAEGEGDVAETSVGALQD